MIDSLAGVETDTQTIYSIVPEPIKQIAAAVGIGSHTIKKEKIGGKIKWQKSIYLEAIEVEYSMANY